MRILLLAALLFSCAQKGKPEPGPGNRVTPEQKVALLELRDDIRKWAPTCSDGIACGQRADGTYDDGDSMLWAGMLCLSGEEEQCEAVKLSVDSDDTLCRNPDCAREKNSSSRDMLLGYLAYLAKTKNIEQGNNVEQTIVANDYKICDDATDNRCDFQHPQYDAGWNLWSQIWRYHGQNPSKDMEKGEQAGELITSLQSIFAPEGYERHLVVTELWIHQEINDWSILFQNAANQLRRFETKNPFYEYVANGPTQYAAHLTLSKCPKFKPYQALDWAWRRAEIEEAWKEAKGWDCIFMINLLTRD